MRHAIAILFRVVVLKHHWIWVAGVVLALSSIWAMLAPTTTAATPATEKPVNWEALNPAFKGATFVNDPDVCSNCH
ncbi:MAG: hypothetical protein HY646_02410, partial [Acidobacteria bacterium]|nr:hypothetical protein [Acidobacteriota bacterium]